MSLNEVQEDCTGYEFTVGSLLVYRAWSVDHSGRLSGSNGKVWKPTENVAGCSPTPSRRHSYYFDIPGYEPPKHESPAEDCTCGYYGFFREHDKRFGKINEIPRAERVVGIAELYGRTLIGPRGARSEKAKVVAVATGHRRSRLSALIKAAYPDVAVYRSKAFMRSRHPVDRSPWSDKPPTFDQIWGETA